MPRAKKPTNKPRAKQPEFKPIFLDDAAKYECNEWLRGREITLDDLLEVIEEIGKVSISWSDRFQCYFCSVTTREDYEDLPYTCVSVRHSDLQKVVGVAMFVFKVMIGGGRVIKPMDTNDW